MVREGAESAGRDPSDVAISGYVRMAVTDDPDAGRESLRQQMSHYTGSSFYRNFFRNTGFANEMHGVETAMGTAGAGDSARAISARMGEELGNRLAMPRNALPGWKDSGHWDWTNPWWRPYLWVILRNPTALQWPLWLLNRQSPC